MLCFLRLSGLFKVLSAVAFPSGLLTTGGGLTTAALSQKKAFICKCEEAASHAGYANETCQTVQMDEREQG